MSFLLIGCPNIHIVYIFRRATKSGCKLFVDQIPLYLICYIFLCWVLMSLSSLSWCAKHDPINLTREQTPTVFTLGVESFRGGGLGAGLTYCRDRGQLGRISRTRMFTCVAAAATDPLGSKAGSPCAKRFLLFSENFVLAIVDRWCCHMCLFVNSTSRR